jgi:hypothetical protein
MQRRSALFVVIVMILSAATGLSTLGHSIVLAADNCLKQPDLHSPQGVRWYYHTDPVTNRKCWYMGRPGAKVPQAALPASRSPPKSENGSDIKQTLDTGRLDNGETSHQLGISADKADRDALFREFVLWQVQHMDAEAAQ